MMKILIIIALLARIKHYNSYEKINCHIVYGRICRKLRY